MIENWPDPRFRKLTPDLLAALSADEVGSAIVQHVEQLIATAGQDARDDVVAGLRPGVQAIYATWLADVEVNNGGFNQFFFNPYGRYAGLALAGYELLAAEEYAAVMRTAIATYEAEREMIAPYHEAGTLEAFADSYERTELRDVDQRYYALGDHIYTVWAAFLRRRPELVVSDV